MKKSRPLGDVFLNCVILILHLKSEELLVIKLADQANMVKLIEVHVAQFGQSSGMQ